MFELTYPLNIQVEVIEGCNHHCFYCYNSWQQSSPKSKKMTIETADDLVTIITDEIKPFHVTITGGEPLLNLDAVLSLAKGLQKRKMFYNLNTNLVLLDEDKLKKLQEVSTNSRFGILASLPHYENESYKRITGASTLKRFYKNLENIVNNTDLLLTVNMVVHKLNFKDLYKEGKFLAENYGVDNFAATPVILPAMVPTNNNDDYSLSSKEIVYVLETLLNLHEDFGLNVDSLETIPRCLMPESLRDNDLELFNRACSAGRSTLSIDYEGNARICSHAPFNGGNLFTEGFKQIWKSFKPFRDNVYVPDECKDCTEFFSCYGGCRVYNYKNDDPLDKLDPRMSGKVQRKELKKKLLPSIDNDKVYKINSNTIYRQEKDNLYTFFNGRFTNVMFVNEEFKDTLLYLKSLGEFEVTAILNSKEVDSAGVGSKLETMLRILIDRRYLV